jgi:hypothetical protein
MEVVLDEVREIRAPVHERFVPLARNQELLRSQKCAKSRSG